MARVRDLDRLMKRLADKEIRKSAARSINRTATGTRTFLSKEVRKELKIKAKPVRDAVRIKKASPNASLRNIQGIVEVSGKPIPLIEFGARERNVRKDGKVYKGVSVRVKDRRKVVRGGFLATMKSGRTGIFKRKGKSRLPIRELFSTSITDILRNEGFLDRIAKFVDERFFREFKRDLEFRISKLARKG